MPLVLADRVQETTTTTGTGTITLAGAVAGYRSFSVIGNGNTTYYCVTSGANWEVGIGTYTASGTTLARTTILASSAGGAAITLAGTSIVFCTFPAGRAVYEEADSTVWIGDYVPSVDATGGPLYVTTSTTSSFTQISETSNSSSSQAGTIYTLTSSVSGNELVVGYYLDRTTNSFSLLDVSSVNPDLIFEFNKTIIQSAGGGGTQFAYFNATGLKILGTAGAATAKLHLPAGTTLANGSPVKFTTGTLLSTVESGAVEYNGVNFYATTSETGSSRSLLDNSYHFCTTADGTTITATTITDAFSSAAFTMQANSRYVCEWHMFWDRTTTAGTHTYTVTTTQTPVAVSAGVISGSTTSGTASSASGAATTVALPATGSMGIGQHYHVVRAVISANATTGGTIKLQVTSSANGITLKRGSHIKIKRLPNTTNVGAWA